MIESSGYKFYSLVEGMGDEMGLEHEGNESWVKWGLMMMPGARNLRTGTQ